MGKMRFGALVAFAVAATSFAVAGITSAFWAIIVGLLASLLVEPKQIFEFWAESER
jgi:predicted benzoate:H+ symporter BenE